MARDPDRDLIELHPGTPRQLDQEFGTTTVYRSESEAELAGRRVAQSSGFLFVKAVRYCGGWSPIWSFADGER